MARKTETTVAEIPQFEEISDLADLSYSDALEYRVRHPVTGNDTTWVWTIAGPAHPVTLDLDEATTRRNREEESKHQQAAIAAIKANKAPPKNEKTLAENRERNAAYIAGRVLSFTPVKLDGTMIEFSLEAAKKLLADPSKEWLFNQIAGAVNAKEGFIKSFAPTS